MVITIDDPDDGSQYDLDVPAAPGPGDVLVVRDPDTGVTRWVLRVTGRNGAMYQVERLSSPAGQVFDASPR